MKVWPMSFLAQDADLFPFFLEEPNDSSVVGLGCRYIGSVDDVAHSENKTVDELLKRGYDGYLQTRHVVRVLIHTHQGPCWYTVHTSSPDFPVLKGDLLYASNWRDGAIVLRRKDLKLLIVGEPKPWIRLVWEEHMLPVTLLLDSRALCTLCDEYISLALEFRPIDCRTREAGRENQENA
ncbi:hypothetical protein EG329_007573 [Mollisiaceae sp. DMI_Dod_QoI]|nr:hypothetical protein EG329_007573 [Helotiales sp. DMI_Dod_QoI]